MAKVTVLLVEDNKIHSSIVREFPDKYGYVVLLTDNIMSAFKAAKSERLASFSSTASCLT